ISLHEVTAAGPERPLHSLAYLLTIVIEDEGLQVLASAADGDRGSSVVGDIGRDLVVGTDVRLRRAEQVIEADFRQGAPQASQLRSWEDFAGEEEDADPTETGAFQAPSVEHCHQDGRD